MAFFKKNLENVFKRFFLLPISIAIFLTIIISFAYNGLDLLNVSKNAKLISKIQKWKEKKVVPNIELASSLVHNKYSRVIDLMYSLIKTYNFYLETLEVNLDKLVIEEFLNTHMINVMKYIKKSKEEKEKSCRFIWYKNHNDIDLSSISQDDIYQLYFISLLADLIKSTVVNNTKLLKNIYFGLSKNDIYTSYYRSIEDENYAEKFTEVFNGFLNCRKGIKNTAYYFKCRPWYMNLSNDNSDLKLKILPPFLSTGKKEWTYSICTKLPKYEVNEIQKIVKSQKKDDYISMCIDLILEETLIHLDEINNSLEGSFFVMGFEAYKPIYFSNKFFQTVENDIFQSYFYEDTDFFWNNVEKTSENFKKIISILNAAKIDESSLITKEYEQKDKKKYYLLKVIKLNTNDDFKNLKNAIFILYDSFNEEQVLYNKITKNLYINLFQKAILSAFLLFVLYLLVNYLYKSLAKIIKNPIIILNSIVIQKSNVTELISSIDNKIKEMNEKKTKFQKKQNTSDNYSELKTISTVNLDESKVTLNTTKTFKSNLKKSRDDFITNNNSRYSLFEDSDDEIDNNKTKKIKKNITGVSFLTGDDFNNISSDLKKLFDTILKMRKIIKLSNKTSYHSYYNYHKLSDLKKNSYEYIQLIDKINDEIDNNIKFDDMESLEDYLDIKSLTSDIKSGHLYYVNESNFGNLLLNMKKWDKAICHFFNSLEVLGINKLKKEIYYNTEKNLFEVKNISRKTSLNSTSSLATPLLNNIDIKKYADDIVNKLEKNNEIKDFCNNYVKTDESYEFHNSEILRSIGDNDTDLNLYKGMSEEIKKRVNKRISKHRMSKLDEFLNLFDNKSNALIERKKKVIKHKRYNYNCTMNEIKLVIDDRYPKLIYSYKQFFQRLINLIKLNEALSVCESDENMDYKQKLFILKRKVQEEYIFFNDLILNSEMHSIDTYSQICKQYIFFTEIFSNTSAKSDQCSIYLKSKEADSILEYIEFLINFKYDENIEINFREKIDKNEKTEKLKNQNEIRSFFSLLDSINLTILELTKAKYKGDIDTVYIKESYANDTFIQYSNTIAVILQKTNYLKGKFYYISNLPEIALKYFELSKEIVNHNDALIHKKSSNFINLINRDKQLQINKQAKLNSSSNDCLTNILKEREFIDSFVFKKKEIIICINQAVLNKELEARQVLKAISSIYEELVIPNIDKLCLLSYSNTEIESLLVFNENTVKNKKFVKQTLNEIFSNVIEYDELLKEENSKAIEEEDDEQNDNNEFSKTDNKNNKSNDLKEDKNNQLVSKMSIEDFDIYEREIKRSKTINKKNIVDSIKTFQSTSNKSIDDFLNIDVKESIIDNDNSTKNDNKSNNFRSNDKKMASSKSIKKLVAKDKIKFDEEDNLLNVFDAIIYVKYKIYNPKLNYFKSPVTDVSLKIESNTINSRYFIVFLPSINASDINVLNIKSETIKEAYIDSTLILVINMVQEELKLIDRNTKRQNTLVKKGTNTIRQSQLRNTNFIQENLDKTNELISKIKSFLNVKNIIVLKIQHLSDLKDLFKQKGEILGTQGFLKESL